jgi:hypothetical protein
MPQTDLIGMDIFLNWQTVLFTLGIFVMTYIIRLAIQFFWKAWRASHLYNDLILHLMPLALGGGVAAFALKYPWPDVLAVSLSARIFYGLFLGMICGLVYGRVRKMLTITGIKTPLPTDVVPDPPEDGKPKE